MSLANARFFLDQVDVPVGMLLTQLIVRFDSLGQKYGDGANLGVRHDRILGINGENGRNEEAERNAKEGNKPSGERASDNLAVAVRAA
jgi:hypothetical protein